MKRITTLGLALGAAIAFAGTAQAQIKMGVAGPLTGPNAAFGAQLKNGTDQAVEDINAAGGIMGQKITVSYGDDVSDPKQGVSVANKFVRRRRQVRGRPLQLRRHHAGLRSLSGKRHPDDHPLGHQPEDHRAQAVEHVPHLRPRRSAGRGRVGLDRQEHQGQEGRDRPRQDDLRSGPRRRDQEGDEQGRREGSPLRGRQPRREGLLGARLQDQGGRRRPRLLGRPAHRRRPDRAPDARPGRQGPADGRRRHHVGRVRRRSAAPASRAR